MAFSEDERLGISSLLDPWCEKRVPIIVRDQVVLQYRVTRHDVLLFEKRQGYPDRETWVESPVAKFRFNRKRGRWTILWLDSNRDWHAYSYLDPAAELSALLEEVDRDPTGIFWG